MCCSGWSCKRLKTPLKQWIGTCLRWCWKTLNTLQSFSVSTTLATCCLLLWSVLYPGLFHYRSCHTISSSVTLPLPHQHSPSGWPSRLLSPDKPNCRACDTVLAELENIDDECDAYGIHMVKIQDAQLAKRYGIKTLPALIYFRNGNPLIFDGRFLSKVSLYVYISYILIPMCFPLCRFSPSAKAHLPSLKAGSSPQCLLKWFGRPLIFVLFSWSYNCISFF